MLPLSTFTKVPSFFLHGFKTPSKRNPWRAYLNLVSTVWVLSYEEIDLRNDDLEIYYIEENKSGIIETDPSLFETNVKRLENVKKLRIINFKIHSESEEGKWYFVSIGAPYETVKSDTPVMVYCSCEDFRYTFSYVLYKYKALLRDEEFPEIFKTVPPKKRNPYQIPWACKHVYTITNLIANYPKHFKFSEEFVLRYNKKNVPSNRPRLLDVMKFEEFIKSARKYFKKLGKIFGRRAF